MRQQQRPASPSDRVAEQDKRRPRRSPARTGRTNQKIGSAQARTWLARPMRTPPEVDRPVGRLGQAGDDVEEGGLAGAVRADEADDRALRDVEVDRAHGDQAAEPLGDRLASSMSAPRVGCVASRRVDVLPRRPRSTSRSRRSGVRQRSPASSLQGLLCNELRDLVDLLVQLASPAPAREEALRPQQHHQPRAPGRRSRYW